MRLYLLTLLMSGFCSPFTSAQLLNPVTWKYGAEHVGGDDFDLVFDAKMDKGWTIYSQFLDDGGPIPTSFTFEESPHYTLVGVAKESDNVKKGHDAIFDMQVAKFSEYAKFTQRIKVKDASKPVVGYLTFMTCDHVRCLASKDVDFEITLPIPVNSKSDAGSLDNSSNIVQSHQEADAKPVTTPSKTEPVKTVSEVRSVPVEESPPSPYQIGATVDTFDASGIKTPVKWSFLHEKVADNTWKLFAVATIDQGWYIYTQHIDPNQIGPVPTSFHFEAAEGIEFIDEVKESGPQRIKEFDQFFDMELVKYKKHATFVQTVMSLNQPVINGELEFMVCNNEMCLPPEYVEFAFDLSKESGYVSGPVTPHRTSVSQTAVIEGEYIDQRIPSILTTYKDPPGDCTDDAETTKGKSLIWTFILGFLGGLLALLTPCVFPMIPLTVSFFSKDTKRKGWVNGAIYGASIIVIYVAIGILITALFGATALNELSTNWIANTLFFLIFVLFAFSFFGYYEITLPSSWTNKSDRMADKGGLIGIFFMAFTLALVSFSCTGPIIGSALVESATNTMGPFVVMLGFSAALALPFGLFAAFPAWLNTLPRSGSWMNSVKVILGFLELALAFKFLSVADMTSHWNFLRYELFVGVWIIIAVAMAAYLFGWLRFPHDSPLKRVSIPRLSFAVLMSVLAVYLVTGFLHNERTQTYNSLSMLSGLAPPAHYNFFKPVPDVDPEIKAKYPSYSKCANNLDCFHDYYEGVTYAQEVNKPVFLDFTGYGCVNCRKTEEHIWVNDRVWNRLKNEFVMVSLYVDDREPIDTVLISSTRQEKLRNVGRKWADFQIVNFEQNTQPLYVIMSPEGEVLTKPRGYRESVDGYVDFLDCGLETYERTTGLLGGD